MAVTDRRIGLQRRHNIENPIERTLLQVATSNETSRSAARDLARLLKLPAFDWRDLARALGRIEEMAARTPEIDVASIATAARVALIAMSRATGTIEDATEAEARLRIQQACKPEASPEQMLTDIFTTLHALVDYDIGTFVEYQEQGQGNASTIARARFALDGVETFSWPARWIEMDPQLIDWLKRGDLLIKELDAFYATEPGAKALKDSPVASEYRRRGARSVINVARVDGGRLCGVISLARRQDKPPFGVGDQDQLNRLALDRAMRLVSEALLARQQRLSAQIAKLFDFGDATGLGAIAGGLVDLIGSNFGWEYVAIFRVARSRNRLEVVAQYDATGGRLSVHPDYNQPLSGRHSGMIGKSRRLNRVLRASKVAPPQPRPKHWRSPHGYIRTNDAQASAMCVPLCLGGEVEWVLDCESTQVDGFLQPDQDAIVFLMRDVERTIQLWFESRLNKALLNRVDQGVVVVDENQRIERLNEAAARLLGSEAKPGRKLADFAADAETRLILDAPGTLPGEGIELALSGTEGRRRMVQASVRAPEDTFSRRIWFFSDVAQQKWDLVLGEMRQTVQDVAAQTRGPLLLANALLRQAKRVVAKQNLRDVADDILDRAARSLAKTDITYERLASSLDAISQPQREERLTSLNLRSELGKLIEALPREDRVALDCRMPEEMPEIRADAERMLFALRSIVGYLVSIRPEDARLDLRGGTKDGQVWLSAALRPRSTGTGDHPSLARQGDEALAKLRQALTAAREVVKGHGGRISQSATENGLEILISDLPVSSRPREDGP